MIHVSFGPDVARPWLAGLDPRVKVAWVVGVSIVAVTVESTTALAALALVAASASLGLRLGSRGWLAIVGLLVLLAWSTVLTQGFFFPAEPRTPLVTIVAPRVVEGREVGGVVLSLEGMLYGAVQSLRLLATALAGFTLSLSTSPERLLAALGKLRLPAAPAYMTTAALRFLPLLVDEVRIVRQARRLRGYRFRPFGRPGDRFGSYRDEAAILLPVIASALRRAETLAESVTARGFDPRRPRTFYPPLEMKPREQALTAAIAAAVVAVVAGHVLVD